MAQVPEIKMTSVDYTSLLAELISEIKKKKSWADTDMRSGLGRTLLELFAYTADGLHFYIRRLASESYLTSAKTRNAMINLCKMVNYKIRKPTAATTTLRFYMDRKKSEDVTIDMWTRCRNADGYEFVTMSSGTISYLTDATHIDLPAIQGRRYAERLGDSDGAANQSFALSQTDVDTYQMNVYVGKEGYTIVDNWIGYFRPVKTFTKELRGRRPGGEPAFQGDNGPAWTGGEWTADTLNGISRFKSTITHNLDLVDPNLFSISAVDSTSWDGTQIYFIYVDPQDENSLIVWYDDNTTTMTVSIKDDLDIRVDYPTRDRRIENDSAICVVDYDDEDTVMVYFGDNYIGKIPRSGEEVRAEYIRNNGVSGNTGKGSIVTIMDTIVGDVSGAVLSDINVKNIEPATGGADVEDLDDIRTWAPRATRSLMRMVTREDYSALITRIHGVQKVQVLDVYSPGDEVVPFRQAKVYVIPQGGEAMSATLKKSIEDEIDKRKVLGTVRVVSNVTYKDINVSFDLWRDSGYSLSAVVSNIQNTINTELARDNDDREIGDGVDYETLLLKITETPGVGSVTLYLNGAQSDVTLSAGEYPRLGSLVVTNKGTVG